MNILLKTVLMLMMAVTVIWACTVQTEDDSVPGSGHGWGGLYYYYTPYTGRLVDGEHKDFQKSDDYINSHSFVLEGVIGFCDDFYAKADLPYSVTDSRITTPGTGQQSGRMAARETVRGLGDASIGVKWLFLNQKEGARAGILAGAKFPTGDEDEGLGSGLYAPNLMLVGGIAAGGNNRLYGSVNYVYFPKKDSVDAGDLVNYTLAYDICVGSGVTFPLEILGSYELKTIADGQTQNDSGSHFLSVSPCVTWTFVNWATICAGVFVPVLKQGYADDYSYSLHLTFFYNF